jgi:hypothetical protein
VAYDPLDGNLWYTSFIGGGSASDGKIRKIQPDGTLLPTTITLTGTQLRADGTPDVAVGALAMDPIDPNYLWVIGLPADPAAKPNYVNKVRVRDGNDEVAGQVVNTCSLTHAFSISGLNGTALTTTVIEGRTHLVAVVSNQPQYIVVIDPAVDPIGCSGRATYNPFVDPSTHIASAELLSVEANGKELFASVLNPDGSVALYSLGPVRLGAPSVVPVTELFPLPEGTFGDLALGSSFPSTP